MYKIDDARGQIKMAIAQQLLPELPPVPANNYRLIVCDPPWQYSLRETDITHRNRTPYPNMSFTALANMPIGAIAAEDAYLLLWTTNNHLPVAFELLDVWEFTYKSLHTWRKVTQDGSKVRLGIGHYGRNCSEQFLVATKGAPGTWMKHGLTDVPNIFDAPRTEHSRKPEQFWVTANRLAAALGGPQIELFARQRREGWDAWGAEVDNGNG